MMTNPSGLIAEAAVVVFDFDGVLAESVDIKTRAFALLYRDFGPEVVSQVVAHHLAFGSMSRFDKIGHYHREFLDTPLSPPDLSIWADRFGTLVEDQVAICPWVEGARDLLEWCAGRKPVYVVSGTPEVELARIVARRDMARYFDAVRGSPLKKRVILGEILTGLGVTGEACVMVGDSLGDYEPATAHGMAFIGRVPPGAANPFPPEVPTVPDLSSLVPVEA